MSHHFEKADPEQAPLNSSKIRNQGHLSASAIPDFLGRLWAIFGEPDWVGYEGFAYLIKDTETGLIFEAYSGASGPSYGADPAIWNSLVPVLESFDELLASVQPADCEIEFENDFGLVKLGVKEGTPFVQETPSD